jgi:hypothetical protein
MNSIEKPRHFTTPAQMAPRSKVAPDEKVTKVGHNSCKVVTLLSDLDHHGPNGPRSLGSVRANIRQHNELQWTFTRDDRMVAGSDANLGERKVRAPQGRVVDNVHRSRDQGKCHRKYTACEASASSVRVKWCGKSAPRTG